MLETIEKHIRTIEQTTLSTPEAAEEFRIQYLGKKGILTALFGEFKTVPNEEKKAVGQALNALKTAAEAALASVQTASRTKRRGLPKTTAARGIASFQAPTTPSP